MVKFPGLVLLVPGLMLSSFVELPATMQRAVEQSVVPTVQLSGESGETPEKKLTAEMIFGEFIAPTERNRFTVAQLVNMGQDLNKKDLMGRTALMWAAENGERELVEQLLEAGADAHLLDLWGRSALDIALSSGQREIVSKLVEFDSGLSS